MSATVYVALRQSKEIEKAIKDFYDAVNWVLQKIPESLQYLIKPAIDGMRRLGKLIAEFWERANKFLAQAGDSDKLEAHAEALFTKVAKPLGEIAGNVAIDKLETNTAWTGSGAEAYKAIVPAQGGGLEDLRDFANELGNTLKEVANGIENFWLAIALAYGALVVAIIGAIAEACTGVGIVLSVATVAAGIGVALGAATTAAVELKSIYDTMDTAQDSISQGIEQLGDEWAKATPRNQARIDSPDKWRPVDSGPPGVRVGGGLPPRPKRPRLPDVPAVPPIKPIITGDPPLVGGPGVKMPGFDPPGPTPPTVPPGPGPVPTLPGPAPTLPAPTVPPVPTLPGPGPTVPPVPTPTVPPVPVPSLPGPTPVVPRPPVPVLPTPPVPPVPTLPGPPDVPPYVPPLPVDPPPGVDLPLRPDVNGGTSASSAAFTAPAGFQSSVPGGDGSGARAGGLGGPTMFGAAVVGNGAGGKGAPGGVASGGGTAKPGQGGFGGVPLGGMGADQGEGDKTHTNKWRVEGSLFDEDDPASTFQGIVGKDPANNPKKR